MPVLRAAACRMMVLFACLGELILTTYTELLEGLTVELLVTCLYVVTLLLGGREASSQVIDPKLVL